MSVERDDVQVQQLTRSVAKAFSILESFSERQPRLTLADLCELVELSPSTLRRLLATLESLGYLAHDSFGQYMLGGRALSLAPVALAANETRTQALPIIEDLSNSTGLNANVGTLYEGRLLYLACVSQNVLRRHFGVPGRLAAAHSTGIGKVLLAYRTFEEVRQMIEKNGGLFRRTPKTITSWEELERELERIRERGYALDDEEASTGGLCVAAPVRDRSGEVVASISASGMISEIDRCKIDQLAATVISHAEALSYKLGYAFATEW